ncbi:MAG TPA: hypothetical protein DD490_00865 [Acidobacteria bacterium]|nr:hypothetical protein [Acidobacteriota bacterium]
MHIVRPHRVTHTYTQHLVAGPHRVFPLLCPVREAEWLDGWDPLLVQSHSGVAEPDCVFLTPATPHNAIWYITRHEPESAFVEMLKITPDVTACRLAIKVRAAEDGGSDAIISYSHTSLGSEGDAFLATFTAEYYEKFMREWEGRMNYFLVHGKALVGEGG